MPTRTVRARVHAGHLEPLEELLLADGIEVTLTFDVPSLPPAPRRATLSVWNLGSPADLSRRDYYDDVG